MKKSTWLVFLLIFIFGCKKNNDSGNKNIDTKSEAFTDVAYGTDSKQKMDVYLPAGRNTDTKLLILIHGGGWVEGDKNDFASYISELQKRLPGYAIANVNYRLASTSANLFPTQEMDIKKAVEFLLSKSGDYIFSKKFVLLGASAGGQLALLEAYKYTIPEKAKAVISFFGPTDMTALYNTSLAPMAIAATLGGTPSSNPAIYEQSSPITFVTDQSCPSLLLHGEQDATVPFAQATLLDNKLKNDGVTHQLVLYPNEGHGWTGDDLTDSFNKIEMFLNANVQ